MSLPERITVTSVMTYSVENVVESLKFAGMEDSDIDIETVVSYIEEDAADYFGTSNLTFQDENGEYL
jgi:hypothetical protein